MDHHENQSKPRNNILSYVTLLHFPFCLFLLMTLIGIVRNNRFRQRTRNYNLHHTTMHTNHNVASCKYKKRKSNVVRPAVSTDGTFKDGKARNDHDRSCNLQRAAIQRDWSTWIDREQNSGTRWTKYSFLDNPWDSFVKLTIREISLICKDLSILFLLCILAIYWEFLEG